MFSINQPVFDFPETDNTALTSIVFKVVPLLTMLQESPSLTRSPQQYCVDCQVAQICSDGEFEGPIVFLKVKELIPYTSENPNPPLTEPPGVQSERSCRLTGILATRHYEMGLIEEGRALIAQNMEACVKRRKEVVEKIRGLRGEAGVGEPSKSDLSLLCKELNAINKRFEEIAAEGEWLEMEAARKKYALFTAEQKHAVMTL